MLSTNIKLYILGTQHQAKIHIIEKLKKDEQYRPYRKPGVIWYFKPLKNLPLSQNTMWYFEPGVKIQYGILTP